MRNYLKQLIAIFIFSVLIGCKGGNEIVSNEATKKYTLFIIDGEGNPYIVQTNSLDSGSIDPSKEGIRSNRQIIDRDLIIKNGFYYKLNPRTTTLTKYQNRNNILVGADSLSLKGLFIENYNWIDEDTLLLLDLDIEENKSVLNYVKVDVKKMKAIKASIELSSESGNYKAISVGFSELREKKLFIGYSYFDKANDEYKATDTSYVAIFEYPSMKLIKTNKETRSVHPGGENTVEPGSFIDEKGDIYFLSCPGVALGNSTQKPTAIMRIKREADQLDTAYFWNISTSSINNHAYSIYYLGNRKAIIRSERKDLFHRWDEHWKVPHFEFYLIDIDSNNVNKLNLPLDKGTRRQCVINEDDIAYISINSDQEGNYIWKYNKKTGQLTKGLQLTGPTSYILRLDRLN